MNCQLQHKRGCLYTPQLLCNVILGWVPLLLNCKFCPLYNKYIQSHWYRNLMNSFIICCSNYCFRILYLCPNVLSRMSLFICFLYHFSLDKFLLNPSRLVCINRVSYGDFHLISFIHSSSKLAITNCARRIFCCFVFRSFRGHKVNRVSWIPSSSTAE